MYCLSRRSFSLLTGLKEWVWCSDALCLRKNEELHQRLAKAMWDKCCTCGGTGRACALQKIKAICSDFETGLWGAFQQELHKHQQWEIMVILVTIHINLIHFSISQVCSFLKTVIEFRKSQIVIKGFLSMSKMMKVPYFRSSIFIYRHEKIITLFFRPFWALSKFTFLKLFLPNKLNDFM